MTGLFPRKLGPIRVFSEHGNDVAVRIGLQDIILDLLTLERLDEGDDAGILLVSGLNGQNVNVGRILALDEESVLGGGEAGGERVVAVDDRGVDVLKDARDRGSLDFLELEVLLVRGEVNRRRGKTRLPS